MIQSIGANLYGFTIGGSLFFFQLLLIGAFNFCTGRIEMHVLELVVYIIVGVGILFNLAVLYWASCILIVLPASWVFRAFPIPTSVAVGIGGIIAGLICWFLRRHGIGFGTQWLPYFPSFSSSIVTGSATGLMLHRLTQKMENELPARWRK